MALWTDIIDPATLTGYARASLADYEARRGTLARWLPNRLVPSIDVKFEAGSFGLVDIADFRAYDAEPTIGKAPSGKKITLELPALGQNIPVSEYNQLRANGARPDETTILATIQRTTDVVVRSVADSLERLRGTVLTTGRATVPGFMDDGFGRSAGNTVAAGTPWSTATADALADLTSWSDTYRDVNGDAPGAIVMSTRVLRAMAALNQMRTQLASGTTRPATQQDVQDTVSANGLPPIYVYDRRVSVGGAATKVVPDDRVLLLPAPVEDVNDWQGTQLGATFWGRTLSSLEADWDIPEADQPGLVTGVYRNEKPPMIAEVLSDAIGMPVLANANLSFAADVL